MALTVGSRLGHYTVDALIGEGGMGQVYQATDTKLNRQVALKILPEAFASDPDRLARFQREAQVLASLNHPGIAQIHGLEEQDGTRALVLELVEGPTLADRIAHGPIPVDEALPIAKQIAEALEAAHEQGVIHRDLKPANIKLKPDGTVKVLDFGLAKALDTAPEGDPSQSPTLTAVATEIGVILGSAPYMSPEQARGSTLDRRTDIWAFGCVFYEMLVGRPAFGADTLSDTIANVLDRQPQWDALPTRTPSAVRKLLLRCLEKNARQRLRDIGDARLELNDVDTNEPSTDLAAAPSLSQGQVSGWSSSRSLGLTVVAALVTGLAVWSLTPRPTERPAPILRMPISAPPNPAANVTGMFNDLAISNDGTTVVYRSGSSLQVRSLNLMEGELALGTTGADSPFFSPDGEWLGFTSGGTLRAIPTQGGPSVEICDLPASLRGVSWGDDGFIVFGVQGDRGLFRVPAAGGHPEVLTDPVDGSHLWPDVLPDSASVLFTAVRAGSYEIAILDVATGEYRVVIPRGSFPRYLPTGHIAYALDGALHAVAFDPVTRTITGDPVLMVEGVVTKSNGAANFALSRSGSLLYMSGDSIGAGAGLQPVWVSRDGREEALPLPPRGYLNPRVSSDGARLAVAVAEEGQPPELWVYDVSSAAGKRLTEDRATAFAPIWTPDGESLVFTGGETGQFDLFRTSADGTGEIEPLTRSATSDLSTSVTADGRFAIFSRSFDARREIWQVPIDGQGAPTPVLQGEFLRSSAEASPDGRWLAYRSDQSGRHEIYLQSLSDSGPAASVSPAGGDSVIWSHDSSELFYRIDRRMMAVRISAGGAPGSPTELFAADYFRAGFVRQYHVAPDGRFLMLKSTSMAPGMGQVILVQNWDEELKARAPAN